MPRSDVHAEFDGTRLILDPETGRESCDATFLIASLLVCVARGDGSISQQETARMLDTMLSRPGVGHPEAMHHLTSAVMKLADDRELPLRLQQIAEKLTPAEKDAVFAMVLDIAMADGRLDPGETRSIDFAGQILGLSQDRIHAGLRGITTG
jgi:uncharacterized tellurite resistance protein B-like protein